MKQRLHFIPLLIVMLCFGHSVKAEDFPFSGLKEDITVRGTVTSMMDEQPLPGVNVVVKGTSVGTVTDIDGNYSLDVPEDAILVFSFIGFLSEEVAVNNQSVINISMVADITQLEEVVVVGYGEQRKDHVTGSVVQINAEEIQDLPVSNLSEALVGKLAGVRVGMATGKPGADNPITIRTSSSIRNAETVLYVIDGVIFEDGGEQFNRLDASEVESISVLKDASAAVYGARASGGVILVKTKRGRIGKPQLSYSSSVGIGSPTQLPDMLSAYEHSSILNEIYDHENGKYRNDPKYESNKRFDFRYYSPDELDAMHTLDYNWLDNLYKDSYKIRHTLNLRGGTENVRYFVGGSYYNETGNLDNLFAKRYSVRANIDANVTNDLIFSLGVSANRGTEEAPYFAAERSPGTMRDTYTRLLTAPRWVPPVIDGMPVYTDGSWNPYGLIESDNYNNGTSSNLNLTGALEYAVPFVKGLNLKAQYSFSERESRQKRFGQDYLLYTFKRTGENGHLFQNELSETNTVRKEFNDEHLQENSTQSISYQLNTSISYDRSFGKHNIHALLVYEQDESEGSGFTARKFDAAIKGYEYLDFFSDGERREIFSSAGESGRLSYIGRLNYNFDEKYLLETSFRYEASQKFHPDHAWSFFPAVSAGWIVSKEGFFNDNINFINFLKLRASAGRIGNDNVNSFQWKPTFGLDNGAVFGNSQSTGIKVRRNGLWTPTLTWQKNNTYNIGLDTRFLKNKLNFSVDAYYEYTYDILVPTGSKLPTTTGIDAAPDENYGIASAKGLEFQLGYSGNMGNDFQYNVNGNFAWNKYKRIKVAQNPAVIGRWDDQLLNDPSNQPGWIAGGIIRTEEDLEYVKTMYDSIDGIPVEMGMIWYEDFRGENYSEGPDGKLDQWDKTIIAKYTNPPFNYGFSLGVSWRGISLGGTFSGVFGHKVFLQKDEQVLPSHTSNVFSMWKDYWSPDNPDASMPRPYQYGLQEQISTFWMRDGHTLRLNNVTLSYALPSNLIEKLNLPAIRFSFTGNNIWTVINPWDHKDPAVSRAYDYPLMRTYNFGLNVTF